MSGFPFQIPTYVDLKIIVYGVVFHDQSDVIDELRIESGCENLTHAVFNSLELQVEQ